MPLQFEKPEDDEDEDVTQDRGSDESREQVQPGRGDEEREQEGRDQGEDDGQEVESQPVDDEEDERPPKRDYQAEAAELRERLARLEGQVSSSQPKPAQGDDDLTPEQKALMSTQDLIKHELGRSERRNQQTLQQIQFQTLEAGDKAAFNSYSASDPRAKKMADAVEKRLQEYRAKGQWGWSRGDVYLRLVGERVVQQSGKAAVTQRQEGRQRIQKQQTRGNSPAGDQRKNDRGNLTPQDERNKRLKESGFFG